MRPWYKIFLYRHTSLKSSKWFRRWYGGVWYLRGSRLITGMWHTTDLENYSEDTFAAEEHATIGINKVNFEKLIKILLKKQEKRKKHQEPDKEYGFTYENIINTVLEYTPVQEFNDVFQILKDMGVVRHLGYNILDRKIYTIHAP